MKKIISLVLCTVMILSLFTIIPFSGASAEEADVASVSADSDVASVSASCGTTGDCTWTLNNGVLTISGNGKMEDYDDVTAPWGTGISKVIIENGVTSIGGGAFSECTGLTSVTIPDSVTSIGESVFSGCTGLTSVTIGNSVTSIGESAFYGCTGLTSVTIPDSVTSIGGYAFYNCGALESVTIPDSVTSIGGRAFSNCGALESVTIGNSVTSIGGWAFYYCTGLTSVTIPDSVTSIGGYAFSNCTGLTIIKVDSGNTVYDSRNDCNAIIEKESNELIQGCINTVIPDSVTSIGGWAFSGCTGLTKITIPDSVTSIGSSAFFDCGALESVTIPDSVTSIGESAFSICTGLTSVTIPDSVTSIGGWAFYGCDDLIIYGYKDTAAETYASNNGFTFVGAKSSGTTGDCTWILYDDGVLTISGNGNMGYVQPWGTDISEVIIGNGVTSIGGSAFSNCGPLESVTIGNSVTSIGGSAFFCCIGLTSVTIPDSVTSIGESAFSVCIGLTSVTIPDSVTSIGKNAFSNCRSLKSVTIPDSVTSIGKDAFSGCTGLTSIKVDSGNTVYDSRNDCNAIIEKNSNELIQGCINTVIPDSVTSIGVGAFSGCTGLTKITIPASVTSIGDWAFPYCTGLTKITIPASVTSIGGYAFYNCGALESVTIPASVTSIGDGAFSGCDDLIIYGYKDTAAETYANDNEITFIECLGERLEGYRISLEGDIGVNFYMSLDKSVIDSGNDPYMKFIVPSGSDSEIQKVKVSDARTETVNGKNYYIFKCKVAAKEMTSEIKAQIIDGDKTGEEYTYSVRKYAEYILKHEDTYEKAVPLVKAMLHYGASAQTLFNNNASDLADTSIAKTDYADPTQAIKDLIDEAGLTNLNETSVGENLTFDGASLNLGSKTAYTLYYKKEAGYNLTTPPKITCTGHEVKVVETAAEIRYVIQNISADELLDNIKVTIGGNTLTVNPATYFYAALTAENTAEYDYGNLKAAVTALYYFNEAAKSYNEEVQ